MPELHGISRVAVLGAGTMGSRIAALFAEADVPVLLMDRTDELALDGHTRAGAGSAVIPMSFDSGMTRLHECDWILEAVAEDLAIKRQVWERASAALHPKAIASTNTSGLSIAALAESFPMAARPQFLGIHFFNPPAKLRLVELIRGTLTSPDIASAAAAFVTDRLDKVVVEAKDTPNFIANRVGAWFSAAAQRLAMAGNYTVEEVDALTGPLIGLPKTGTYRLMDVIGLDVWACIMPAPHPPYFAEMLRSKSIGEKTGAGFYRRVTRGHQKSLEVIDLQTLEYYPIQEHHPAEAAVPELRARLRHIMAQDHRTSRFLRPLLTELFIECRRIAPEIAHSNQDIDRAMHHGYGWTLGPFQMEAVLR